MKLYKKLIKPVLYYPGQSYEPKKKNLENPAVWYPEEEKDALLERFKDFNNSFETVAFDENYIEYEEDSKHKKLNSSEKCKDCHSMSYYGCHAYCRIEGMRTLNSQMDISTIYVDPESKPSWCPIDKLNAALDQKAGDNL